MKLYAGLGEFLPGGAHGNTTSLQVPAGSSAHAVLDRFHVPRERTHLVLLNGVYLAPAQRDAALLADGDVLAAWPPVAGG